MTDCDTPLSLMNATFQWINDNLKDQIDFVIWTGDSARHDNDEQIPRTEKEIVNLNKLVVSKFVEVFGKDDNIDDPDPTNDFVVPIVPTFGNNDILPHNIFEPGPNKWTRDYADVWRKFIPEAQRHSFARGGWFFTEVIPNKLAVFSLNTMYFYEANTAVDGCYDQSEPGYEHMEWLKVQLEFLRKRGMKAIMTGHVPPARTESKQNWDETCWQTYSLWMKQYRDVVVTGMFGHMNIDHFMFQDGFKLDYGTRSQFGKMETEKHDATDPVFSIESKADYLTDLRQGWTNIPTPPAGMSYSKFAIEAENENALKKGEDDKKSKEEKKKKFFKEIGGKWAERYSLSLVSPSVVPNFYPTLRVVEYNITGLENEHPAVGRSQPATPDLDVYFTLDQKSLSESEEASLHNLKNQAKKSKHKKHKKNKHKNKGSKPPFTMPDPPSSTSPPGPAYSPQPFTLKSYTQYFANLTFINHDLEHSAEQSLDSASTKFEYQIEYDTKTDKIYNMKDMTVRSYLDLAHRIAKDVRKHGHTGSKSKHVVDVLPDGTVVDVGDESGTATSEEDKYQANRKNKDKKKKKHNKGKNHKGKGNEKLWHTFIKRAFVMTKSDEDMDDFDP